jgi:hypothetical protein
MERQKQKARKANGMKAQATCEESLASSRRCGSVVKEEGKKKKRKGKTGVSTIARLPFGIMRHNLEDLSPNNALFFYEVCTFLPPYHFYHVYTHTHTHTHLSGFPFCPLLFDSATSCFGCDWGLLTASDAATLDSPPCKPCRSSALRSLKITGV